MNMGIHTKIAETECLNKFELKYAHRIIHHAQMQFNPHTQWKTTAFIHACIPHVHFISLTVNITAEVKMDKITYLRMNSIRKQLRRCNVPPNHRPVCSLITQQRRHPRVGHDFPRNKEQASLHIAKGTQNTAKPTQLGLSDHPGARKG